MSFISFFCLITEAKSSITMLNSNGESGHHCLISDCGGKALSFFLPIDDQVSCESFIHDLYTVEVYSPYSYFTDDFSQEMTQQFVYIFFYVVLEDHIVLIHF